MSDLCWDGLDKLFKRFAEADGEEDEVDHGDDSNEDDKLALFKAIKESINASKENKDILIDNFYIIFNSDVYPQKTMKPMDIHSSSMIIKSSLSVLRDILSCYLKRNKLYVRALRELNMKKKDLVGLIQFYEAAEYCINNHKKRLEERSNERRRY